MKKPKIKVIIEEHNWIEKRFDVNFPYCLAMIDYDDVNHSEVDAAISVIKDIVEKHWDEELFKEKYKEELMKTWNKNEYGLQKDYDSLEDYLSQNNINC